MASPDDEPARALEAAFAARADGFRLRRSQPADADFLWTLFAATQAETVELPPVLVRLQFDSQRAARAAIWSHAVDWIVLRGERPIGRFMVDFSQPGRSHGVDLAVLPTERRGAAGLMLLRAWTEICDRFHRSASLSVRPGNPAIAIYRRLGFVQTEAYVVPVPMQRQARSADSQAQD